MKSFQLVVIIQAFNRNKHILSEKLMYSSLKASIRYIQQSGSQRRGTGQLKNETIFLIKILRMAERVYHLLRRQTSTLT